MRGGDVRMEGGGHRGEGVVARGGYVRHGGGAVGADSAGFAKGGEAVNRVLDGLAWVVAHWVHWHRWRVRRRWMATEGVALVRWYEASTVPQAPTRPQNRYSYGLIPLNAAVFWTERTGDVGDPWDSYWRLVGALTAVADELP